MSSCLPGNFGVEPRAPLVAPPSSISYFSMLLIGRPLKTRSRGLTSYSFNKPTLCMLLVLLVSKISHPKLAKKDSNAKLVIKLAEHSGTGLVTVEGGTERDANSIKEMIDTIQLGAERRTVSSTQMNADSSRSHLLCSIVVSSRNRRTGSCIRGKLTLVDLAGSERVGKSGATGDQLKEAQSINKSLSALGDVIGALTTGVKHVPYRNHALTMMMSDSLGGNSKTLMFVCTSPADYNAGETINALQFAARCKTVTNSSSAGAGSGAAATAQVQALRRELQKLQKLREGGVGGKETLPMNKPTQLARPF